MKTNVETDGNKGIQYIPWNFVIIVNIFIMFCLHLSIFKNTPTLVVLCGSKWCAHYEVRAHTVRIQHH